MAKKILQKKHESLIRTMAYIYAVLLKVSERTMTAEEALELIKTFIAA